MGHEESKESKPEDNDTVKSMATRMESKSVKTIAKTSVKTNHGIAKKKTGKVQEEIHTVFDLDSVIMEDLDFEMEDDNTESKEKIDNEKEVMKSNIKKKVDKGSDANVEIITSKNVN